MNIFAPEQSFYLGMWDGTKRVPRLAVVVAMTVVLELVAIVASCNAQDNPAPAFNDVSSQTQTPIPGSGHDYQQLLGETVSPSNGSVNFKISFPVPKSRGITLPYDWTYNSSLANSLGVITYGMQPSWTAGMVEPVWNTIGWPSATAAVWSYAPPNNQYQTFTPCNVQSGMTFTGTDGVMHDLYVSAEASSSGSTSTTGSGPIPVCGTQGYVPANGDGEVIAVPDPQTATNDLANLNPTSGAFVVIDKNGTKYSFGQGAASLELIEDKNGNQITGGKDTAGRPLTVVTANASGTIASVTADGLQYTPTWSTVTSDYNISIASLGGTANPALYCLYSIPTAVSHSRSEMTSLELPNGQSYSFQYNDIYGLVSKITFPDGGWIEYTWELPTNSNGTPAYNAIAFWGGEEPQENDGSTYESPVDYGCGQLYQAPVLASRTVSFDGTTIAQTQTFSYTTSWPQTSINGWNQKTTTVTTTDNVAGLTSTTVYTYSPYTVPSQDFASGSIGPAIPLESEIDYYDWGQTATPTTKVNKTWRDQFHVASETTTIMATGEVSGTVYKYITGLGSSPSSGEFVYLSEKDEYDYGAGALPAYPARITAYNYTTPVAMPASVTNYQIYTNPSTDSGYPMMIPPQISSVVVGSVSSSGVVTIQSATQYGYDGTALQAVTAVQHDPSYGTSMLARGNLTSVTHCTTLPTSLTGSCSVGPTTTYVYDITGQLYSMTDPNGNTTNFSFADSPSTGNSPYGNSNAYLTQITYPAANGVTHQENFQYNYQLGYLTQTNDENSNVTIYNYNNSAAGMNRLSQISYPDGGKTTYTYNDQVFSPSVTTSTLINSLSNVLKSSVTTMDGMDHPVQTQLTTDIDGVDTVNTTYDGEGHVRTVTNPHWLAPQPTDGVTTNYYDAFGRKIQTVEADGNTTQNCYNGVSSTPAVSNCNAHLGTATTGTWADSADEMGNDWQQTTDGLGRMTVVMEPNGATKTPSMETDYSYDVLSDLLSVTQKGNTSTDTPRTSRNFTYNSLGQLITSFNPESGTESYTYDLNGNLISRTSPLVNSTTAGLTQILGYCYDALNRVTYKFYSAPPSNCTSPSGYVASFTYDAATVAGAGPSNDIGRLTRESAYINGTLTSTRNPYQYDPMGRLKAEQQTPYSPNGAVYNFLNAYDQAGDMTCTNNGFATVATGSTCGNYTALPNSIDTTYTYDGVQRLSLLQAGNYCTSGTCTPFAQTALFTANTAGSYGPAGITAATYGNGLSLSRRYDNKMRVVDHQVYQTTATQASGSITITGALASGDSGKVNITLANVELSVPYSSTTNSTPLEIANALIALINQSPEVIPVCSSSPCWAKMTAGAATTTSTSATIPLTAILEGTSGNLAITASASTTPSFTVTTSGSTLTGGSGNDAYYYQLAYNANGNIHSSNDSINSDYGYFYDTLNRLTEAQGNAQALTVAGTNYDYQCWAYDGFGNRTAEADTDNGCSSFAPTGSNYTTQTTYNASNHVTSTTVQAAVGTYLYDVAGNVINDGVNQYVYDLDGRICAVWSNYSNSSLSKMTQYVYDAEGRRVAKGTITAWPAAGSTCAAPTAANGFTLTNQYLRGVSGDQDTELDGSGNWIHTNIFAGSGVQATYWNSGTAAAPVYELSYIYNDWLGTKREQFSNTGSKQSWWDSDPFGDYMTAHGNGDANELHLTGKEHDAESGNDYFGARYYNSPMGRFMSPDWSAKAEPVPYAKMGNPQTLNLYAFVGNNPISHVDVDGHVPLSWGGFESCGSENAAVGCGGNPVENYENSIESQANLQASLVWAAQDQAKAQQQNQSSTATTNPNAAAEQHQYDLVVNRVNKLLGTKDAAEHIDSDGNLDGGNYAFPINHNDKSDAAFQRSLNKALGETDGDTGAHGGLTPPTHRLGFSTSLHHDNDALHVDHFNGAKFPVGTLLHAIVDVGIGHLMGPNFAFSYSGVQQ